MSSRARKRARAAATGQATEPKPRARQQSAPATEPKPPSRSELRNQSVRERLVPLREGERPAAVTIAAAVSVILLLANIGLAIGGYKIRGSSPGAPGVVVFSVLLGAMAWGLWQARYWAVLGMEALLGLTMLLFGLSLPFANNARAVLVSIGVLVPAAILFWFLIRAMARIQMPERR